MSGCKENPAKHFMLPEFCLRNLFKTHFSCLKVMGKTCWSQRTNYCFLKKIKSTGKKHHTFCLTGFQSQNLGSVTVATTADTTCERTSDFLTI